MPKILVIDDESQVRSFLKVILEKQGYEVIVASDGREGAHKQRQSPADLIISDILMPEKDGLEVMMELKGEFPNVKIIAISGGGSLGVMSHLNVAKKLGAFATIPKPLSKAVMLKTVSEALNE